MAVGKTSIYALIDPRDGSIRYIGRTSHDPSVRVAGHIRNSKHLNMPVNCWIRKLKALDLKPEWKTMKVVRGNGYATEQSLIKEYRKITHLLNLSDGGPGPTGFKWSEDSKEKLRQVNLGKKYSAETNRKKASVQVVTPQKRARVAVASQERFSDPEWKRKWYEARWPNGSKYENERSLVWR